MNNLFALNERDFEKFAEKLIDKYQTMSKPVVIQDVENDQLLPQIAASRYLQVSIPTLISWRKNKNLPYYNFNGRFFYSKTELLDYARNRRNEQV